MTHICIDKPTIIGLDNGLSPGRRQAITWTNVGILLIGPLGTKVSEILSGIQTFSFKKMHLKMSSVKRGPFCPGVEEFTGQCWNSIRAMVADSGCVFISSGMPQGNHLLHSSHLLPAGYTLDHKHFLHFQTKIHAALVWKIEVPTKSIITKLCICNGNSAIMSCAKYCCVEMRRIQMKARNDLCFW